MQNTLREIGNNVLGILLIIAGVTFLYLYLAAPNLEDQPNEMLLGGLFLLAAGIVALPKVTAKIGTKGSKILLFVFLIVAVILAFMLYNTVDEEIEFLAEEQVVNAGVIQRLKDIRVAQEEYYAANGYYSNNFDTLIAFVNDPRIPIPRKWSELPDSILEKDEEEQQEYIIHLDSLESMGMNLETAKAQGYEVRDTGYVSVFEQYFKDEIRKRKKLPPVSLDSLPYSPFTGEKFILKTDVIDQGGVKRSVVLVQDPTPFGRKGVRKDTLRFGSLTDANTSGSWGNK